VHFYCEKLLVARNQDWGALKNNRPLGAEDLKCGGWKFSKGSTPINSHPAHWG